jgi:hypothetical protein
MLGLREFYYGERIDGIMEDVCAEFRVHRLYGDVTMWY